jgi:serine protease AprX
MSLRRSIRCLAAILTIQVSVQAQTQYAFRISFSDKNGADISNPLSFLSQRALDRRTLHSCAVDTTDLPVAQVYIDTVLDLTQGKLHVTSRWLNTCVILVEDTALIAPLLLKPYVSGTKYVGFYLNGLHKGGGDEYPGKFTSETEVEKTTGSAAYYGPSWDQTNLVKGDCLHDNGWLGEGKLIAVMDDGFLNVDTNPAFDTLMTDGRVLDMNNFVLADPVVYDYHSHGTQALSALAGYIPNTYVGAAPKASYALYITEDQNSEQPIEMDNLVAAMERADSLGTDVISTSLGYNTFFGPVPSSLTYADIDGKTTPAAIAANMATIKGILVVVSAGNEGGNSWNFILTPGDADSALTIGSVNISGVPAGTSGYGPNSAGHVKPDVCALGSPAAVLLGDLTPHYINGTSFATPQIAGFAACLWQAIPTITTYKLRDAIKKASSSYNNPGVQLGYGIPDFCLALQSLGVKDPNGPNAVEWIRFYPNPVNDQVSAEFYSRLSAKMDLRLMDITGRVIIDHVFSVHSGNNKISFGLPDIASGVYICRVNMGDYSQVVRLLKN